MTGRIKNFISRLFKSRKSEKPNEKNNDPNAPELGDCAADIFTTIVGSWTFILCQSSFLLAWVVMNTYFLLFRWDPYPFIFLNLFLSMQAAYTGPIIMMSQNRQTKIDRETMRKDYELSEDSFKQLEAIVEIMKKYENDRKIQFKLLREILDEVEEDDEHTP